MSRVGRQPILVSPDVKVDIRGNHVTVSGPRGELSRELPVQMRLQLEDGELRVSRPSDAPRHRSLHGLTRTLLANMVTGVSEGFERVLEIVGIGYRAELSGSVATFHLGYSHPIKYELPKGVGAKIEKAKITLSGIDKEVLGMTAAKIRSFRKPEPYKGKGIRYAEEYIKRKAGKTGAKQG